MLGYIGVYIDIYIYIYIYIHIYIYTHIDIYIYIFFFRGGMQGYKGGDIGGHGVLLIFFGGGVCGEDIGARL